MENFFGKFLYRCASAKSRLELAAWDLSVWDILLGNFRLGSFVLDLSLKNFSVALSIGTFRSETSGFVLLSGRPDAAATFW